MAKVSRSNNQIKSAREFLRYFADKYPERKKDDSDNKKHHS